MEEIVSKSRKDKYIANCDGPKVVDFKVYKLDEECDCDGSKVVDLKVYKLDEECGRGELEKNLDAQLLQRNGQCALIMCPITSLLWSRAQSFDTAILLSKWLGYVYMKLVSLASPWSSWQSMIAVCLNGGDVVEGWLRS
ncbi:hypothetical protein CFP56_027642 [Quercus suber]|uniref:Uncharacterized protein n=1 Tax=Quercus suber TaxID=58331 RepID=A0AAW0JW59_QUESU